MNGGLLAMLWGIYALINVVVFALYGVDKRRAIRHAWRIPESTLLLGTWLLGGVGALAGMKLFRHKTKHMQFVISSMLGSALSLLLMAAATLKLLGIL